MLRKILAIFTGLSVIIMPISVQAAPNCDANAIIWCGATTQADLMKAISSGDGHNSAANIAGIYSQNSIQTSQITNTVNGTVTKSGNVIVNGKVVATDAQSVGRQNMPGSTAQGTVFIRPTSVSFASDNLEAFVLMQNNQFVWAIIKACGNPVLAKPVVAVVTRTAPPPPVTTTVHVPNPVPVPVFTAVSVPQPVQIPKTGPEAGLAGLATPIMWFGLAQYRKSRRSLRKSLLNK